MMMDNDNQAPFIKEITWKEAREQVLNVDKTLANLIDKLNPAKELKLLKATYSYGDLVVDKGILHLPKNKGQVISINDPNLDKKIKDKLNYSSIPLFLTLQNSNEVFNY